MDDASIDITQLPRIPYLRYEDADGEARELWDADRPVSAPGLDATRDVHPQTLTLLRHPRLAEVYQPFVRYLMQSDCLPARHRELAVLRTAWNCGSDTQWHHHVQIGLACGLTEQDVDRVPAGPTASWETPDRAVLRACDELHEWCRLGDETWCALAESYDTQQMLELIVLVGNYRTLAYIQGSVGIKPFAGWSPDIPGNRFLFRP